MRKTHVFGEKYIYILKYICIFSKIHMYFRIHMYFSPNTYVFACMDGKSIDSPIFWKNGVMYFAKKYICICTNTYVFPHFRHALNTYVFKIHMYSEYICISNTWLLYNHEIITHMYYNHEFIIHMYSEYICIW